MFDGKQIGGGTIGVSKINATGSPSSANFLRGDGTWNAPAVPAASWTVDGEYNLIDDRATFTPTATARNTIIGQWTNYIYYATDNFMWGDGAFIYNGYAGASVRVSRNLLLGTKANIYITGSSYIKWNAIIGGYNNRLYSDGDEIYNCTIIGGKDNIIKSDAYYTTITASQSVTLDETTNVAVIGVENYTAANRDHTVILPQLRLGRGTSGTLPSTIGSNTLHYELSTGVVSIGTNLVPWNRTSTTPLGFPATGATSLNIVNGLSSPVDITGQDTAEIFDFLSLDVLDTGRLSSGAAHFIRFENDGASVFTVDINGQALTNGIGTLGDATQIIKTAHIQLTQGQIQALNTTSVEIVPQPATGEYIQIIAASAYINHNGTTYGVASELRLVYQAITATIMAESIATFISAPGDVLTTLQNGAVGAKQITLDKALHVHADADATGAGGTIDVYVQYAIIDTN